MDDPARRKFKRDLKEAIMGNRSVADGTETEKKIRDLFDSRTPTMKERQIGDIHGYNLVVVGSGNIIINSGRNPEGPIDLDQQITNLAKTVRKHRALVEMLLEIASVE